MAEHEHVVPAKTYWFNFLALMVLLFFTVLVAFLPHGWWSAIIAVTIASAKALLVILFFMHVRWSSKLVTAFVIMGFAWLMLLFIFTVSDYIARPYEQVEGWEQRTEVYERP
jgi:cytochrome c oxidase subunit 4